MRSKIILAIALGTVLVLFTQCNNDSTSGDATEGSTHDSSSHQSSGAVPDSMKNDQNANTTTGLMTSMNSMIDRMKKVQMSGDFDIDLANMMIEHHQGAIDMSEQEVSSGKDEKIKALAQKIINAQKEEIKNLQDFVKSYKPSGMKHGEGELQKSMSGMETRMKSMQMTGDIDTDFANMMIDHHQGAIEMSKKESSNGMSSQLKKMAQKTINDANKDIKEFKDWLQNKK